MTRSPIDDYVRAVAKHLKLRGAARRQALADLLETLTEAAVHASEHSVIADVGPASEYAANLDEQFGTTQGAHRSILGIPNSFARGIGRRMAATFDPADERLMIPRIFGAGWTLNMGAVAVRLGMLSPDDVDDEVLGEAMEYLPTAQAAGSLPVMLGLITGILLWVRRKRTTQLTGRSQTGNLIFGLAAPAIGGTLLASAGDDDLPAGQRLTMPAVAAAVGCMAAGINAQLACRPKGKAIAVSGLLAGLSMNLLLNYLPVRSALLRQWQQLDERGRHA